jgi:hypothetical protein
VSLQIQIDFTAASIRPQNNPESQMQVVHHAIKFGSQVHWVLEQLQAGRRLTSVIASQERQIVDLRARVFTLRRKLNIDVKDVTLENGMKEFYIEKGKTRQVT